MRTYESTVSIIQPYNFATLRKRKSKYIIHFLKFESPPSQPILVSPPIWPTPSSHLKKYLRTKKFRKDSMKNPNVTSPEYNFTH